MGSEWKKCPFCAEEIRVEAVVCRFCNRDLQASPQAPPPQPAEIVQRGVAKEAERRTIQAEVRRRRTQARIAGVLSGIVAVISVVAYRERAHEFTLISGAAALVLLVVYWILRPRYTGAECPYCRGFAVRKSVRSGCVSASYFLKCDDCQAEFGGTSSGCSCLVVLTLLGSMASLFGILIALLIFVPLK